MGKVGQRVKKLDASRKESNSQSLVDSSSVEGICALQKADKTPACGKACISRLDSLQFMTDPLKEHGLLSQVPRSDLLRLYMYLLVWCWMFSFLGA